MDMTAKNLVFYSQWLHNKKFSGLSEGIFDILISDQIRGGWNKKYVQNLKISIFPHQLQFYKIPLTVPTICHNISKTALILLLSFSEVEF